MSEEIQRIIGTLQAEVAAIRRRLDKAEGWITRGIMALLGAGAGAAYLYAKAKGLL